jgi:hypothetical protein
MKNIKLLIPVLTLSLTLFSCNNYLDVNTDPSHIAFDKVSPAKLLPGAQVGAYAVQATSLNQLGNVFSNTWAPNVQQFSGGYTKELQLTIDNSFYNSIWDNTYLNVMNFQQIINYPNTDHSNDNFVAVAKICKAYYLQYIVDLYGDAPYTEAFKGIAVRTPKYNDDQFIYRQLLGELDDARALIDLADPNATDISTYDVMLGGVMNSWKQFANTIELKMLLRMSNSTGAVAAYRDLRLQNLTQDFITDDISINPGYGDGNDSQMNPLILNFFINSSGTVNQNYAFVAASGHYYKSVSAYTSFPTGSSTEIISGSGVNYPNVLDPRRLRIMRNGASQTTFRGVTQGSSVVDVYAPSASSGVPGRIGYGTYNPYNLIVPQNSATEYGSADGYVMTLAEASFLQAEAALRWPNLFTGGDALFNAGIQSSMDFRGVTAGVSTYISTINNKPNFGWTGTNNQKLHAIMYQKWLAMAGINGIETYLDNTRTGYPLIPLSKNATNTMRPKRLIYPISEYVANSANVPNITPVNIFSTTDPSLPFWLLGDPALGN